LITSLTNTLHYKTLADTSSGQFKEKGSRFIGYAFPCSSEEEVRELLGSVRKQHHQSTHVCYAYRLGWNKERVRANDDGEPANSAGMPILGQIQSFDLTNVLVAVVRYYGGTKLGVGGLMSAYKTAAHLALAESTIEERDLKKRVHVELDPTNYAFFMQQIKLFRMTILEQDTSTGYFMELSVPVDLWDEFVKFATQQKGIKLEDKGYI
jgi:uncharacterized YigZ family protein